MTRGRATGTGGRQHLPHLDGMRGVAALFVVLHHVWLTAYPSYPQGTGPVGLRWLIYGHFAVAVFIVLSGFSLTMAPAAHGHTLVRGAQDFLRRRAWRILPAYWCALALSELLMVFIGRASSGGPSLKGAIVHALLLQDVIASPIPNGTFWSIAPEWQIYFLFPLLLWSVRRWGALPTATCTLLLVSSTVLAATTTVPQLDPLLHFSPQFLVLFVFGMAAARPAVQGVTARHQQALVAVAVAGFAVMAVVIGLAGSVSVLHNLFWYDIALALPLVLLLPALTGPRPLPLRTLLERRPLVQLGSFSYSLYLIHGPLLAVLWLYVVRPLRLPAGVTFLVLLALVPLLLAASWGFYRLFERPFMTRRDAAPRRMPRSTRRGLPATALPAQRAPQMERAEAETDGPARPV